MKKLTMTEIQMQLQEQFVKGEMRYWQIHHPTAKITWNKKKNEIVITYPLPKDLGYIIKAL